MKSLRLLFALVCFLTLFASAAAAIRCDQFSVPYNTAVVVPVCLGQYDSANTDDNEKVGFKTNATFAAGDVVINKDVAGTWSGEANVGTLPTDRGNCYSQPISSSETTCREGYITYIDQTDPQVWIASCIEFRTYGNASAFYPTADVNVVSWAGTTVATPDTAGYPKVTLKTGTGTGEVSLTSGGILVSTLSTTAKGEVNTEADTALTDYGALKPTVAGRTLDVATTGEAGLDLGNTTGTLDAAEIASSAFAAAKFASDYYTAVNTEVDTAFSDYGPLKPTTAGRTLDVTTTGEAGVDLSNVNGTLDASEIGTNAIGAAEIAADAGGKIADITLRRHSANVEASSDGDALDFQSLYGAVAKQTNNLAVSGSNLNIYRADGVTLFKAQTLTSSAGAAPITGLGTN